MYTAIIESQEKRDGADFESIRFHGLSYLLRQGKPEFHVSRDLSGTRRRPEVFAEEFAVIADNLQRGIYTFYVEPKEDNANRCLVVTITSSLEARTREVAEKVVAGTRIIPKYHLYSAAGNAH